MSGLPVESLNKVIIGDGKRIDKWLSELNVEALLEDQEREVDDEEDEFERTFELLLPIATDSKPLTSITLRAPDLGCAVLAENFDTESSKLAAILAELSGLTMQVILRLSRRDVARMEAWIGPFVEDTD